MSIYQGVWYNHASSELILTLNQTAAGFLSAALVIWVQLVAVTTWPILRFMLYTVRQSLDPPQDVLHAQRQVMLRNSSTPGSAATQLFFMLFGWRSYRVRPFRQTLPYLTTCVAIFLLWTICGLYAPYIYTRTGTDVLLAELPSCGWPTTVGLTKVEPAVEDAFLRDITNSMFLADTYAQQCYESRTNSTGTQCNSYPRQSLPVHTSEGTCPFGSNGSACISVNSTVMTLDTNLLDSNHDFGINARQSDTVQYRKVSTCSPIRTTGYVEVINTTGTPLEADYVPGETLIQFMYGPRYGRNYTYQYEYRQIFYPITYTVNAAFYSPEYNNATMSWVANSSFYNQPDGDVSLVFLNGNSVRSRSPVYDPFFAAGLDPLDAVSFSDDNVTYYTSTRPVTVLGCKEQHQFCIGGSNSSCTPLSGTGSLMDELEKLKGVGAVHVATARRLNYGLITASISTVITQLGPSSILASRTLSGSFQMAELGMAQWRKEVISWQSTALARLQGIVLSYAAGPDNPDMNKFVKRAAGDEWSCKTQRVRDAHGYVNFGMVGLIVLVVLGSALIVFGFAFEPLAGMASKLSQDWRRRHTKWLSEGLYHLHKETLQVQGVREWQDEDTEMPKSHWPLEQTAMDDGHQAVSLLHVPKS